MAIAAAVAAMALLTPLAFGLYYFGLDLTRDDLGQLCAIRQQLAAGDGLWLSRLLGNGAALLVRPDSQLFYPVRWLQLAFSPDLGASIGPILHLTLGAASAAWLARSFRLRPAAAAGAGIAYVFTGVVVDLMIHSHYVVAVAWLPLAWAAARRGLVRHRRRASSVWLAPALGGLLLGGEPQAFGLALALVVLECVRYTVASRAQCWRRLWPVVMSVVAGSAFGSLLLVPALAEARLSGRTGLLSIDRVLAWSFGPELWPAALLPTSIFAQLAKRIGGPETFVARDAVMHWNGTPYLGCVLLVAASTALSLRRARWPLIVAATGLLLAVGAATPVMPALLHVLPPLRLFRYPEKYLIVTALALTLAAAIAIDRVLRQRRRSAGFAAACATAALALVAFSALIFFNRAAVDDLAWWSTDDPASVVPTVSNQLLRASVACLALLALSAAIALGRPRYRPLLLVVVVADLATAALRQVEVGPSLADLASPLRNLAAADPAAPPVLCTINRYEIMRGHLPGANDAWLTMAVWRLAASPCLNGCDALISANPYSPLQTELNNRLFDAFNQLQVAPARALGCTHLVVDVEWSDPALQPVAVSRREAAASSFDRLIRVYRIVDPIPAVFIAAGATLAPSADVAFDRLLANTDPASALAVIDDPLHRLPAAAELPIASSATVVDAEWRSSRSVTVRVSGQGGAVVGLRTAFQVGWRAQQAGRPLPVVRAAGQHLAAVVADINGGEIAFEYWPPGLGWGMAGAGGGILLQLLLVMAPRKPNRGERRRCASRRRRRCAHSASPGLDRSPSDVRASTPDRWRCCCP